MPLLIKNLLFTALIPGTVAVYVPVFVFAHPAAGLSLGAVAGAWLLLAGAAIYLWCLWDFASSGRGTPAPLDPPKRLVERGLYRHTRNPMYVGVLSILFGWSALFQSLPLILYSLAVAACFHLVVVFYEEPHLRRVFGPSYDRYRARVGRWLSWRR